ncbi:hypothetical protein ES288_A01G064500v1 [Gossypium darwinii]|uniref:UDP-glycosyltransferases domain-containing protein n=1 Tax=Gossypium darwinii TaxID=34276 RepID=A0A5D2HIH3_GOSDA|nr:hypothetical protein ES288_A01G064500v1 [Gossypium darwinii]
MRKSGHSKLHIAMFPWVAYAGSYKLAHKGHQISFFVPKGVQPKLENMNQYLNLIQFFPLLIPHVDGLLPGAETTSVVPLNQQKYLAFAIDQTRDQVEGILKVIKPDMVFYDFWFWIPDLARQLGILPIFYVVVSSMSMGLNTKALTKEMNVEEVMELPTGCPPSTVKLKPEEAAAMLFEAEDFGSGLSFRERIRTAVKGSDAIAFRTCRFSTVEEALPEGFQDRVGGRGLVYGGWVPQEQLLHHPNIGCFVNHCGYGIMWEFLLSDRQIVLIPEIGDQILNTRLMVNELKIGVEVERGKNREVSKESLSEAIKFVMDKDNETANMMKKNHAKLKQILSNKDFQEGYINNFIKALQDLVK